MFPGPSGSVQACNGMVLPLFLPLPLPIAKQEEIKCVTYFTIGELGHKFIMVL